MTFMIITTLYLEMIADNNVDVIMFCDFKDAKMTRFD